MKWFNAKKNPPKEYTPVIVTYLEIGTLQPRSDAIAILDENGEWWWWIGGGLCGEDSEVKVKITHWATIPKPPANIEERTT